MSLGVNGGNSRISGESIRPPHVRALPARRNCVLEPGRNYMDHLPGPADFLLIIEVAQSSISFDREVKLTLYARHGIPEVWLLDLAGGELAVYREPVDGQYRVMRKPSASESISPLLVPDVDLRLEVGKSWSVPF